MRPLALGVLLVALIVVCSLLTWQHNVIPEDQPVMAAATQERCSVSSTTPPAAEKRPMRPGALSGPSSSGEMVHAESLASAVRPTPLPRETWEADQARQSQLLRDIAASDADAGLNAGVRQREEELRGASAQLWTGMPASQVLELLGNPTHMGALHMEPWGTNGQEISWKPLAPTNQAAAQMATLCSYFPTEGQLFDRRNGFGFSVLYVRFFPGGAVEKWAWESPPLLSSSGGSLRRTLGHLPPPGKE